MFECAGWCVLDSTYVDKETSDEHFEKVDPFVKDVTSQWRDVFSHISVDWVNGRCFLIFFDARNHGATMHQRIAELAELISTRAPRSYGVIHVYDNELAEKGNAFHVIKIAGSNIIVVFPKIHDSNISYLQRLKLCLKT